MKRFITRTVAAAAGIVATASAGSASAHDFKAGTLELKHPWSAVAPPVAPVLGGYVTIVNTGTQGDRLLGGATPVAQRLEVHESSVVDGVARMRPARDGIEIQSGQTVNLEPGGAHIMLVNPRQRPKEGEKFKAVLEFEKAGQVEIEFVVQKPKPSSAEDHSGHSKP